MSESILESATQPTEPELTLTRFYVASPQQIFDMWTNIPRLRHWWGPEDARLADAEVDARPGGSYRFVLRRTGGKEIVQHGTYLEFHPPWRLTFSMERDDHPGEILVTSVENDDWGAMTSMMVRQSIAHGEPFAHLQLPEWLESLTRLSECLE